MIFGFALSLLPLISFAAMWLSEIPLNAAVSATPSKV
jgi:hypothetical protein